MLNQDKELLKEAEELEFQSKIAIKNKDYGLAIQNLMKAKDNYTKVGLTGQVSVVIREIVRLQNLAREENIPLKPFKGTESISMEQSQYKLGLERAQESKPKDTTISEANGYEKLENARALASEDKYEEAMKLYNEAYSIFKHLDYEYESKQILWQLNEIRDYQRWAQLRKSKGIQLNLRDIVALASAEKRRQKIQKGLGAKPAPSETTETKSRKPSELLKTSHKLFKQIKASEQREEQLRKQMTSSVMEQQKQRKIELEEKKNKLQSLQEKKRQEDELFEKAQEFLDMGNQKIRLKEYDAAKSLYSEAINLFTQLGWHDQITILQKELCNIDL
ncbi:MAG: hypothetical protein ACFE96_02925, partial [Candidatus Hermodarchaeota archaeon]